MKKKPDLQWAYYTGEETAQQVMMRWDRLYPDQRQESFFYSSSCDAIIETIQEHKQQLVIVDSIQTIKTLHNDASPGSPAQVRTCSEMLTDIAKHYGVTMIIIGHVTKG